MNENNEEMLLIGYGYLDDCCWQWDGRVDVSPRHWNEDGGQGGNGQTCRDPTIRLAGTWTNVVAAGGHQTDQQRVEEGRDTLRRQRAPEWQGPDYICLNFCTVSVWNIFSLIEMKLLVARAFNLLLTLANLKDRLKQIGTIQGLLNKLNTFQSVDWQKASNSGN